MTVPEVIAHRGYTLYYPENTLIALEAAIRAGARYVEVDVQLAADGTPVLFHDDTLTRICNTDGAIHDYDATGLARLRALDFDRFGYRYAQTPIATLADLCDFLARHRTVTAFVELKHISLARFGVTAVLDRVLAALATVAAQVVLISFDIESLAAARARTDICIGAVVERWRERRHAAMRALAPEFLFCDQQGLPRWGHLRFGTARLAVYEVDDVRRARELAARGVEFIETFAIGEMLAAMA